MSFYSVLTTSLHKVQDNRGASSAASDYPLQFSGDFGNLYWATVSNLLKSSLQDYVTYSREGDKCRFRFKHDTYLSDTDQDVSISADVKLSLVEGKGVAVVAIFGLSGRHGFTDTIRGYVTDGDLANVIASWFNALSYDGKERSYYIDAWDDFSTALSNISEHPGFASAVEDAAASQSLEYPFKDARIYSTNASKVLYSFGNLIARLNAISYADLSKTYPALRSRKFKDFRSDDARRRFVVRAIIESSKSYQDAVDRLNHSGLGLTTWKVDRQSSTEGVLSYTDPHGNISYLFIYPEQVTVEDSSIFTPTLSVEDVLSAMYDELTDRALRHYKIEFRDIVRREDYFTLDYETGINIQASAVKPLRQDVDQRLASVSLRAAADGSDRISVSVTFSLQAMSKEVPYLSEYAGSGYVNTAEFSLKSDKEVSAFVSKFLSFLGRLQADGYVYDHYCKEFEKFASKVSRKQVVSDAASTASSMAGLTPIESTSGGSTLYRVLLWPGQGYYRDVFYVRADSEESALEALSTYLIKEGLTSYYYTEDEYADYLSQAGISEEEDTSYLYLDGTMEGAPYPIYLLSENLSIEKV